MEKQMVDWIRDYLNFHIEPAYNDLYYQKNYYTREHFDAKSTNEIIENCRKELYDHMKSLDDFQFLINKNSFPDYFNKYLLTLLTVNTQLFYDKMNENCHEPRHNNNKLWQIKWTPDNINDIFCKDDQICENCQKYLNIIKEYNAYNEHFYLTGNEDDSSYSYQKNISTDSIKFIKRIIINNDEYSFGDDYYEEEFRFNNYKFIVGKKIPKINPKYISGYYVANYQCSITNHDYINIWNIIEAGPVKYHQVDLYPPNDSMKEHSEELYSKYKDYYENNI